MKAVVSRPERPLPRPRGLESGACSKAHHMRHPNQLAPLGAFFHLAGNQFRSSLPLKSFPASATHLNPVSNMSCQRREGQVEAVTGEKGDAERRPGSVAGSESLSVPCVVCVDPQGGMESVSCRGRWPARATAPVERSAAWCAVHPAGDAGAGDGRRSARVGSARAPQREPERLVMVACREPCDPWGLGRVQPFGQRSEHHGDLARGGFQTGEGSVAPGCERGTAGRASKCLDLLGMAMLAISDQSVDVSIGDAEGWALLVGTGVALRVSAFGSSSPACDLAPEPHRQRRWTSTR